jgi:peptidyl-prolyl cis-trans isomerase SurA
VRKTVVTLSFATLCLVAAGCHTTQPADVVATVNGHPILRSELDRAYAAQLGEAKQENPSPDQADALRLAVLDEQLIPAEIIQQRAAKMNLTATPEEVDDKLKEMKAPYTEEQFQQRLAAQHITLDDVKRDVKRSLTVNKLLHKEIDTKITVSDSDIASYYALHKSEFNNIVTSYHLAQIVVTTAPTSQPANLQGSKATSEAEAKKKIEALHNRAESGEDFGSLAMNFSENPRTSTNGGDMGMIPESDLQKNPVVFNAISKDPAGQHDVSEPQIQQQIRQGLHDTRSQLLKAAYFEMLRDQAKVENFLAEQMFKSDAR